MKNILVIGSINTDLVINAERIPSMGETIKGCNFKTVLGGKGCNQAIAAKRLGASVKMIGAVGNDIFGKNAVEKISAEGLDVNSVRVSQTSTGIAMITVCGGNNMIILDEGANKTVVSDFIEEQTDLFEWADILVMQFEIPIETVLYAAKKAKEHNCKVLVNPAPMIKFPEELLQYTDIFVPNEHEASLFLGYDVETDEDIKRALQDLIKYGVKQPIITLGSRGSTYIHNGEQKLQKAFEVEAVDTTAAGDSFIGGLCAAVCEGMEFEKAVEYATAVSALTVGKSGATSSLPTKTEVEEFLKTRSV